MIPALIRPRGAARRASGGPAVPYWRQRGWRLSAGFTALVAGTGLLTLAVRGPGGPAAALDRADLDASTPLVKTAAAPVRAPAAGRAAGCRTDDRATAVPPAAPADTTWREVAGARVPTSASAGPLLAGGPLWWCFARTPAGAAMAAHVIPLKLSDTGWRTVAERQVVPGRARDFLVAKRARLPERAVLRGPAALAGFTVPSYSPAAAEVDLLVRGGQGALFTTSVSLVWSEGDWKAVPRSDGTLSASPRPAEGSRGFVMWRD
ncbi:hypothetical protein [Streptomyces lichenis]|uniref:DUF8175 domain-containing protein n=1 Tax=Streptomyces lichenis TaxID=2306967 RepID=A0ABT0IA62_9ACTN|nr:hypothetical protein [Streptomyces lichenis]MCK8678215.1 hypothetical protein [Streptomyces lichenis]